MIRFTPLNLPPEQDEDQSEIPKEILVERAIDGYNRALSSLQKGNIARARCLLEEILELKVLQEPLTSTDSHGAVHSTPCHSLHYVVHKTYASMLEATGKDLALALYHYRKAAAVDLTSPSLILSLGQLALRLSDFDTAANTFYSALQSSRSKMPPSARRKCVKGLVESLFQLGDFKMCLGWLDIVLRDEGWERGLWIKEQILKEYVEGWSIVSGTDPDVPLVDLMHYRMASNTRATYSADASKPRTPMSTESYGKQHDLQTIWLPKNGWYSLAEQLHKSLIEYLTNQQPSHRPLAPVCLKVLPVMNDESQKSKASAATESGATVEKTYTRIDPAKTLTQSNHDALDPFSSDIDPPELIDGQPLDTATQQSPRKRKCETSQEDNLASKRQNRQSTRLRQQTKSAEETRWDVADTIGSYIPTSVSLAYDGGVFGYPLKSITTRGVDGWVGDIVERIRHFGVRSGRRDGRKKAANQSQHTHVEVVQGITGEEDEESEMWHFTITLPFMDFFEDVNAKNTGILNVCQRLVLYVVEHAVDISCGNDTTTGSLSRIMLPIELRQVLVKICQLLEAFAPGLRWFYRSTGMSHTLSFAYGLYLAELIFSENEIRETDSDEDNVENEIMTMKRSANPLLKCSRTTILTRILHYLQTLLVELCYKPHDRLLLRYTYLRAMTERDVQLLEACLRMMDDAKLTGDDEEFDVMRDKIERCVNEGRAKAWVDEIVHLAADLKWEAVVERLGSLLLGQSGSLLNVSSDEKMYNLAREYLCLETGARRRMEFWDLLIRGQIESNKTEDALVSKVLYFSDLLGQLGKEDHVRWLVERLNSLLLDMSNQICGSYDQLKNLEWVPFLLSQRTDFSWTLFHKLVAGAFSLLRLAWEIVFAWDGIPVNRQAPLLKTMIVRSCNLFIGVYPGLSCEAVKVCFGGAGYGDSAALLPPLLEIIHYHLGAARLCDADESSFLRLSMLHFTSIGGSEMNQLYKCLYNVEYDQRVVDHQTTPRPYTKHDALTVYYTIRSNIEDVLEKNRIIPGEMRRRLESVVEPWKELGHGYRANLNLNGIKWYIGVPISDGWETVIWDGIELNDKEGREIEEVCWDVYRLVARVGMRNGVALRCGKVDEWQNVVQWLMNDLALNPWRLESWIDLGRSYQAMVDLCLGDVEKLRQTEERENLRTWQIASFRAFAQGARLLLRPEHAGSPDDESRRLLFHNWGCLCLSIATEPMKGVAMVIRAERDGQLENPEVLGNLLEKQRQRALKLVLRQSIHLFREATRLDRRKWQNWYGAACAAIKCQAGFLRVVHYLREAIALAENDRKESLRDLEKKDKVFEPIVKLVSFLSKGLSRGTIDATMVRKALSDLRCGYVAEDELLDVSPAPEMESKRHLWQFMCGILEKVRHADDPKPSGRWHHKDTYRLAWIHAECLGNKATALDLMHELSVAFQTGFWKRVFDTSYQRPGKHLVYIHKYTTFTTSLLVAARQYETLTTLSKKVLEHVRGLLYPRSLLTHVISSTLATLSQAFNVLPDVPATLASTLTVQVFDRIAAAVESKVSRDSQGVKLLLCLSELKRVILGAEAWIANGVGVLIDQVDTLTCKVYLLLWHTGLREADNHISESNESPVQHVADPVTGQVTASVTNMEAAFAVEDPTPTAESTGEESLVTAEHVTDRAWMFVKALTDKKKREKRVADGDREIAVETDTGDVDPNGDAEIEQNGIEQTRSEATGLIISDAENGSHENTVVHSSRDFSTENP
ncbi:Histone transcription regulator 3 [Gaertneriomyces sp. JEL0708]|nr:Histone transcription regulator 3 [Gaertneriomyces sp. JEL0708]